MIYSFVKLILHAKQVVSVNATENLLWDHLFDN